MLKLRFPVLVSVLGFASLALPACGFNAVVELDQDVLAAWSEVENQYQRRADLVPNLVEVVKGEANFEQETLQGVITARSEVAGMKVDKTVLEDPQAFERFEKAQAQLSGALSRLLVVVEKYPDLKANQAFRDLSAQLEGTENRITVARGRYIEAVSKYNKVVLTFPSMIGAKVRGKDVRPNFKATTAGAEVAPKVQF